ncbi:MAG: GntR family transcriptional regulator [Gemmatimonadaceae bacterium]
MLPFLVDLKTGDSPFRQVTYAATRAIVSGEMSPGEAFPSVRELSQALKINPNTAHKIVAELVRENLLEVVPGIGTIVARPNTEVTRAQRQSLRDAIEALLIEARRAGATKSELNAMITEQWKQLFGAKP